MLITRQLLRKCDTYYRDDEVNAHWSRLRWPDGVAPLVFAGESSLPVGFRMKVLMCEEVLGDLLHAALGPMIDRAVMCASDEMDVAGVSHEIQGLPAAGPDTYQEIGAAAFAAWTAAGGPIGATWATWAAAEQAAKNAEGAAWSAARIGTEISEREWQLAHVVKVLESAGDVPA